MTDVSTQLTLGVEEECILIDQESGAVISPPNTEFHTKLKSVLGDLTSNEVMASQLEIKTNICSNVSSLRNKLLQLRSTITEVAALYHLSPFFASTHPFGKWREQICTNEKKFLRYVQDFQRCEHRAFVCGMHLHVGIPDEELRIRLQNEIIPYLPYFLALSTSSPFWNGEDTGLYSYRLSVWHDLPRTGLPPMFKNAKDYTYYINTLIDSESIKGCNEIWWDVRQNVKTSTLELRICDICTFPEDTIAIAALYQSLIHMLLQDLKKKSWKPKQYLYAQENIWQAQRYGTSGHYIQQEKQDRNTLSEATIDLIKKLGPHAKILGCEKELQHLITIMQRGTSAELQKNIYYTALQNGATNQMALKDIVKKLTNLNTLSKC